MNEFNRTWYVSVFPTNIYSLLKHVYTWRYFVFLHSECDWASVGGPEVVESGG